MDARGSTTSGFSFIVIFFFESLLVCFPNRGAHEKNPSKPAKNPERSSEYYKYDMYLK